MEERLHASSRYADRQSHCAYIAVAKLCAAYRGAKTGCGASLRREQRPAGSIAAFGASGMLFTSVDDEPSKAIIIDANSFLPPARARVAESYSTMCERVIGESLHPLVKLGQ